MSKTFRLFISSTFSDFKKEREVLQTKVFPIIKEYATQEGYTFQPIDLRWGVSNEAQLNQKTLELCLSEVRTCKTHMTPNFLIMVGDRYGWVPLPYAIEQEEFKAILENIENKELLNEWYELDKNHLPSSWIIKERRDKYVDYDTWMKVENKLRGILQKAVKLIYLPEGQSRKYFLSATEAEVEEGIIPYHKPTAFQTSILLKKNPDLLKVDSKYIFGLLRKVNLESKQENMFIPDSDEHIRAKAFKDNLKRSLLDTNILEVKTEQTDKENLKKDYLEEFEKRVVKFLKEQIDTHKRQEKEKKYSSLEIEQQAQNYYAINKRKGFLKTELLQNLLLDINNYIDTKEVSAPFILYGASGRGKSALMAQAIDETEKRFNARVVYRFIGATPHSNFSKEILISIFDALDIDLRRREQKEEEESDTPLLNSTQNAESFEEFSSRVHHTLLSLDKDIVIFIDALDQLQNDDQFLWLPKQLPANIKIIISCLKDDNYQEDTKYFKILKEKFSNFYEIAPFSEPISLLKQILKEEHKTLSEDQEKDFLDQYIKVNAPLYIVMAAQEIKEWKSGDKNQTLASTQKGVIEEFISNLSEVHHHNKKFISKVLGYIYASRDGLSESELLQLLATDADFIEQMAPEIFHENPNHELPLVHWSRLQTEFKPFLSIKEQDNEELMYFFHREFEDAIIKQAWQREEHEAIIEATQKKILQNQDKDFDENRWGKLYITLITEYELRYRDDDKQSIYSFFISSLSNESTLTGFLLHLLREGINYTNSKKIKQAIAYKESFYLVSYLLTENDIEKWYDYYAQSLQSLAITYEKNGEINKAIKYGEECLEVREISIAEFENNEHNQYFLAIAINNLAGCYEKAAKGKDEISVMYQKSMKISKKLFKLDPNKYFDIYTTSSNNVNILESTRKNLQIIKQYGTNTEAYITALNTYSDTLYKSGKIPESIEVLQEQLLLIKSNFDKKPIEWMEYYITSLNNIATRYFEIESFNCIPVFKDSLAVIEKNMHLAEIFDDLYKKLFNSIMESSHFFQSSSLYIYNQDFKVLLKSLFLFLEQLNNKNSAQWNEFYNAVEEQLKQLNI